MTPWTVTHQAPLSMGLSRQEYWSGLPFPSSDDLPNPGVKPGSPALQMDSSPSEPPGKPISHDHKTNIPNIVNPLCNASVSLSVHNVYLPK